MKKQHLAGLALAASDGPLLTGCGASLNASSDADADGLTILMATHETNVARDVAHSIAFPHEGCVLEQGSPEQNIGAPREERTREFLSQIIATGRL